MDYIKYGRALRELTVGESAAYPFATYATVQEAVDNAQPGDHISIYPGSYDESVLIPDTKRDLVFVGAGSNGRIAIAPSAAGAVGLTLNGAKGITLVNIDIASPSDAPSALYLHEKVRGFRAFDCKIEGPDVTPLLVGKGAAPYTDAKAPADCVFSNCEVAWTAGAGVLFGSSIGEFPSEIYFYDCLFHDCAGAWVALAANGAFAGALFKNCSFLLGEGVAPTVGIDVAVSPGYLYGGAIELASNAGALGTHTNMKFVGVAFTDGVKTV